MIRFIFRLASILFLALIVIAFFTNPSKEDFQKEVEKRVQEEFDEHLDKPLLAMAAEESKSFATSMATKLTTRDNFGVCSIYTLDLPTGKYRFIGAFKNFIPLQAKNPLNDVFDK
jgi:hypothetical protein